MIKAARWILPAALLLTTGCGLKDLFGKQTIEQYVLVLHRAADSAIPPAGPPALPGTLTIAPYVTRGIYDDRGIVFRLDDFQLDSYQRREWAIPLREMLGTITAEALRAKPLTAEPATFDLRSPRSNGYRWRGTVREFEEVNRGNQVLAAVHLEVELIRASNDSVVWRGSERIERAVPEPTKSMKRIVESLSSITGEVLATLIERARAELAAR